MIVMVTGDFHHYTNTETNYSVILFPGRQQCVHCAFSVSATLLVLVVRQVVPSNNCNCVGIQVIIDNRKVHYSSFYFVFANRKNVRSNFLSGTYLFSLETNNSYEVRKSETLLIKFFNQI